MFVYYMSGPVRRVRVRRLSGHGGGGNMMRQIEQLAATCVSCSHPVDCRWSRRLEWKDKRETEPNDFPAKAPSGAG